MPVPNEPAARPGVALVGLGTRGAFHLERLLLRDDCRVVAGCDPRADVRKRLTGLLPEIRGEFPPLLEDPRIQIVWISETSGDLTSLARQALSTNHDVVLEPPLDCRAVDCSDLQSLADDAGRRITVVLPRRLDDDFQNLQEVLATGCLGALWTLQRTVWQLSPREPADLRQADNLDRAFGLIDQAVQLAGRLPDHVWCRARPPSPRESAHEALLLLELDYHGGPRVGLNLGWSTPAVLDTGWRAQGMSGTCFDGQQTTATEAGELIETPLPVRETPPQALHDAILGYLTGGGENPGPLVEVEQVLRVIETARRALADNAGFPFPAAVARPPAMG